MVLQNTCGQAHRSTMQPRNSCKNIENICLNASAAAVKVINTYKDFASLICPTVVFMISYIYPIPSMHSVFKDKIN